MLDSADAKTWNTFSTGDPFGPFRYWEKDSLHHVVFASDDDVDMEVVHKTADERFSVTVERFSGTKAWTKLIINGSFGYIGGLDPFLGQTVMGDVIENKRKTISYPLKDPRAYLSFENSSAASATVYTADIGAPPVSADAALGGHVLSSSRA